MPFYLVIQKCSPYFYMYDQYVSNKDQVIETLWPEYDTPNVSTEIILLPEGTTRDDTDKIAKQIEYSDMYRLHPADFRYWVERHNEGSTPEECFKRPYARDF